MGGRNFEVASRAQGSGLNKFDAVYFAASVDKAETNKKYAEALRLDYPILSDPEKEVAKQYGVVSTLRPFAQRWTFYIGKDGRILAIDKSVNVATHGADVAAKLEEFGVAKK
jgi:peroxiredoxin Q/BCP